MLGSNLETVPMQNSSNENENLNTNQPALDNNEIDSSKNDSPNKKLKRLPSNSKQSSPKKSKESVSKNTRENSSKRLRTIDSFLITSPKAKRVKSTENDEIVKENKKSKKSKKGKGKDKEKENDVIIIDDNNNETSVNNDKDTELVILIDNSKNIDKKNEDIVVIDEDENNESVNDDSDKEIVIEEEKKVKKVKKETKKNSKNKEKKQENKNKNNKNNKSNKSNKKKNSKKEDNNAIVDNDKKEIKEDDDTDEIIIIEENDEKEKALDKKEKQRKEKEKVSDKREKQRKEKENVKEEKVSDKKEKRIKEKENVNVEEEKVSDKKEKQRKVKENIEEEKISDRKEKQRKEKENVNVEEEKVSDKKEKQRKVKENIEEEEEEEEVLDKKEKQKKEIENDEEEKDINIEQEENKEENKNQIKNEIDNHESEIKLEPSKNETINEVEIDNDYESDISVETLSSFTSSDLSIDSEVEARLNSQASEMSNDREEDDDDDKKSLQEDNLVSSKTDDVAKSSKKSKNNKIDKSEGKKEKKKSSKKDNKKENNKEDKVDKNENNNDNNQNKTESENNPTTTQNNNSSNTKTKKKRNIDEIPDNEIVELKNRRVIFHEKKIQIETLSETLIELLCFHEFKNSQNEPISRIPERFNSLIAKLVQDSDASESSISNSIYSSLNPVDEEDEDEPILLRSAVPAAIRNVAVRKNYGIEKEGSYFPNLAIFRWEVKNLELLPKTVQEKVKIRRKIRERASDILKKIVDNMSEEERNVLFRIKKKKSMIVEENKSNDANKETNNSNEQKTQNNTKTEEKEKNEKTEPVPKENEKRKLDQLQGQRSIAGFFSPIKKKKVEEKVIPETIQEKQNMEFDNRFKSFYIKSNTEVAPLNYFNDIKIEYNFDDDKMDCDEDVSLDHYLSIIRERKIKNIIKKRKEEKQKLIDSDIVDLTDENGIPQYKMKLLQFFENHRPAYYGTWRKETKIISGRHPFKKDTELLDYDFDSEIEWVADEEGEECLSDEEDDEEDIMDAQDEQGDDDGWLVPHGYLSDDEGVEEDIDKVNKMDKKNDPKPMKVVPLIPIIVGPIYAENSYDEIPDNINLAQYTTQLLDPDMEFPLDPFKEYPLNNDTTSNNNLNEDNNNDKKLKITPFPEEHLAIFVKIVQYSLKGMVKIIDEAKEMEEFKNIPKIQIEKKLREIAIKEKPDGASKICWCIKDDIYQKLNMKKPEIPDSLKIENAVTSPKRSKGIYKNIKSPSNNDKKKQSKEPMLNFLPKKKNTNDASPKKPDSSPKKTDDSIMIIDLSPKKSETSPKKTDNTINIDLENEN